MSFFKKLEKRAAKKYHKKRKKELEYFLEWLKMKNEHLDKIRGSGQNG